MNEPDLCTPAGVSCALPFSVPPLPGRSRFFSRKLSSLSTRWRPIRSSRPPPARTAPSLSSSRWRAATTASTWSCPSPTTPTIGRARNWPCPPTKFFASIPTPGLNPKLAGLKSLFDDGHLAVIQGVGYPNPNRSHFRSTEIWQTASDADRTEREGWLGRYFDNCCAGADPTVGVAIGNEMPQSFTARTPTGSSSRVRNSIASRAAAAAASG